LRFEVANAGPPNNIRSPDAPEKQGLTMPKLHEAAAALQLLQRGHTA